jgi:hypothetical protein
MSDNSSLKRYLIDAAREDEGASSAPDQYDEEDYGTFGWLRGVREHSLMLEFRKRDGGSTALDYGWLKRIDFDPSVGITLHFDEQTVRIVGRNLDREIRTNVRLLRGLFSHRIPWIKEAREADLMRAGDTDVVIEEFRWS